jgi:hypothetical protein
VLKVSEIVEGMVEEDELIYALGLEGLLNLSSYARKIQPQIESKLRKPVKEGTIVTALARFFQKKPIKGLSYSELGQVIQTLTVHTNLEGMTFERTESTSNRIRSLYPKLTENSKAFFTQTEGLSEITIVCEAKIAAEFRRELKSCKKIYDKRELVGISIKFDLKYLDVPNTLFELYKKLAFKKVNIIEIISTATELTFLISKEELVVALDAFQKNLY